MNIKDILNSDTKSSNQSSSINQESSTSNPNTDSTNPTANTGSTNPTANTDSTNPSINPNHNDNSESEVSEAESDNPYKNQYSKLEQSYNRIRSANGKVFSEIDSSISTHLTTEQMDKINNIQDSSERRINTMEKSRDKLRTNSDMDTSRETTYAPVDKKVIEMNNEISRAEADAVYEADKVIKGMNIPETESSRYKTLVSELKNLMSIREKASEQHIKYLNHKINPEQSTQSTEQQAPESSKRKRDDSEESVEPEAKRQATQQQGSLIDDFADPSQEFPGYTDGDD